MVTVNVVLYNIAVSLDRSMAQADWPFGELLQWQHHDDSTVNIKHLCDYYYYYHYHHNHQQQQHNHVSQ